MTGVYELPIGPGKKFLNQGGMLRKNVLGGWQLSGIFTYLSGTPISVNANNNDVFLNGFNRANYDPGVALHVNWNNYYKGLPVFTTSAFSDPGFKQGNEVRNLNVLRNPFFGNENMALAKHFYFGEHLTGELRIEYANLLNRMRVCGADNNVNDGANFGLVNPGTITVNGNNVLVSQPCQAINPRQGQIVLKLSF
jgi:hypothetical protein